ncbi:TonB-linked outer membrane protein, SusC/RagA family [Prevotella aff. ruminicola Tc2-24]|uniref:TonB-linked outer membrane protein, SusC/RagA family n=2 Tax=Prevotella aff. ruminicola Tc2-24 TaxID=81582 RepID=A0A1I0QE09_9BACT|nr:TonB-linked outer membrane protein, SusC/RagA family [Prevotella aff. ruminicola Tc2-24]
MYNNNINKPKKQISMKKHFLCLLMLSGACLTAYAAEDPRAGELGSGSVTQQGVTVKGVVKDAKGEPIIGATVTEKGTKNATVTDFDGNYSLNVSSRNAVLVVSYIGFVAQEVKAGGDVTLQEDNALLNEVVVIGYGTQRKGDITSAITSVKSEDFAQGNIRDAGDLIKGKVAGLTIANGSGDPNAASSIRLRGIISLEGGNSPLVLVDGLEGSLSTVAPENIESIDVLKDASAAAIYGTRGAAGVIIITTKAGKREARTTANYSGYLALSSFGKKLDMMDGSDIRAGKTNYTDRGYDTDWLDAVSRTALTHNHNVNISGGNKSTSYNADFTFRDQQGVFINTYGKEMRFNGGLSHWMFNDILKLQFNILKRWHENGPVDAAGQMVYRQALMRNPTEPIYGEDGDYYENFGINYYYNPVGILKEKKGEWKTETTRLTGNITLEPIKGWQTNLMLSTERYNAHDEGYFTSKHYGQKNSYTTGYATHSYDYSKTDNLELTSTYKHQWGDHRFEALVGYSYQYDMVEGFNANNTNFLNDFFEYNNLGVGQYLKEGKAGMGSYKEDDKLVGFFGRVSYGFSDKYNVLLSIRREGSSKFGANHKWGSFPSASLGWTISNEKFMEGTKSWLDNLKLRAGYGVTGVIPTQRYQSLTTWALGSPYYYDSGTWKQGLKVDQNPNPDLKWEKSTEYNVGLDFAVLGERIWGTIDVYRKKTVDMLFWYDVPVPPNLYSQTLANVGEMRNQGIEVAINAIPVRTKDFEWKTTATFAHNATKLISLSNDLYETANRHYEAWLGEPINLSTQIMEVGKPLGQWYGLKSVGVSENGLWMIENPQTGEVVEFNDNMLTDKETWYQNLGNAIPKVNIGWSNTFKYKDFDLNMQFTGQFGFKILNEARAYYQNNAVTYNRMKDAAEAPYSDGNVLKPAQKQTFVSYYLSNGNFFKLSNITIGYNVPLKENKYVKAIRAYASADNVFTITSYNGLDPELTNWDPRYSGIDQRDKYPTIHTFTFGLNVTF